MHSGPVPARLCAGDCTHRTPSPRLSDGECPSQAHSAAWISHLPSLRGIKCLLSKWFRVRSGPPRVCDQVVEDSRLRCSAAGLPRSVVSALHVGISSAFCAHREPDPPPGAQNPHLLIQHGQGARRLLAEGTGNSRTVVEKSFILAVGPHPAWPRLGPGKS